MTLVVDASCVVAALVDSGPHGQWADALLAEHALAAPHLMLVEAANVLRRAAFGRDLSGDVASLAHADLVSLPVELFDYEPFADRIWGLRDTMTAYDAWYVAVAEAISAPLATVDVKLTRAAGARCAFKTPPG